MKPIEFSHSYFDAGALQVRISIFENVNGKKTSTEIEIKAINSIGIANRIEQRRSYTGF